MSRLLVLMAMAISSSSSSWQLVDSAFQCPPDQNWLFQDPEDCSRFYQCAVGFPPSLKQCPDGLLFNPDLQVCDWPENVVCSTTTTTTTTTATPPCRDDWSQYEESCYRFFENKSEWADAENYCADFEGGHLASIQSMSENEFVSGLVGRNRFWLGGYRQDDLSWAWTDGSAWGFTTWHPNEPNNAGKTQNYLEGNYKKSNKWDDDWGWEKYAFVCKYKPARSD